ncbi:MAG TPA: DHA2 family efflux MFS transporter permease subunit [Candidatus Deferrimicrobiaceae bacterium]|nr:DHA2 family efflux MFS transporter permease subunit [Candidatus Deferrimicrobiaceae bacterium]
MNGRNRLDNAVGAMRDSKWIVAVTVMLPTLIEIIDISVANVSLDHIRGSLSAGIDEAAWVLTSYLVSNAIIIPMTGWLARTFGRKRYLVFSILLFTGASLMCGAATSLGMLVFFRVLQGIGGGALQPLSQAILLETFPPREHGMAMAIFGIGIMFGPIAGPLMGGYITDTLSWRWIFYVNIPIGLFAIMMVKMFIVDPPYMKRTEKLKVDTWGIALLTVGIGALQIVLDKGQREDWFQSDFILVFSAISVLALIAFVIVELFLAEHPIVDLRAFKNVSFSSGNVVMFVAFFNLLGSIVLLPLYAQILLGYTATLAGLVLSPGGVATLFTMPIVGKLIVKRNPKYLLALGVLICAFSTRQMAGFNLAADFGSLMWPRIYLGIGMGLLFIPLTTLTLSSVPKPEMGNATSIYNLLRNLGGSFGVAFSTTIFTRRAQFHQSRLTEHLTWFDQGFRSAVEWGRTLLPTRGIPEGIAEGTSMKMIYGQVIRQATAMGFNDAFWILSVLMACVLPLLLLMRRPDHQNGPPPQEH